jgi:hypothetical protein
MRLVCLFPDQLDLYREHFRIDFAHCETGTHPDHGKEENGSPPPACSPVFTPLTAVDRSSHEKPVLISGFRNYHAASKDVKRKLQVLLIKPRTALNAVREFILIRSSEDRIHDWETAGWIIALNKVTPAFHSALETAGLLSRAARALQIPVTNLVNLCPGLAEQNNRPAILSAASLPLSFLHRCQRCGVDVFKTSLLARYNSQERPLATVLTCRVMRLSVSHMRRFERLVRDIALRENTSVLKILRSIKNAIRQNPDMNWLKYMEKIRSPERARMDEKVSHLTDALLKKPATALRIPTDYEENYIDVTFRISSPDDLKRSADALIFRSAEWIRLLNLVQKGMDEMV